MKLVIRLLSKDGDLLGWEVHQAAVRGDGTLRAASAILVPIDVAGTSAFISTHWCDVNVETRVPTTSQPVAVGDIIPVFLAGEVIILIGPAAGGLPPITTRSNVVVEVRSGGIGAKTL